MSEKKQMTHKQAMELARELVSKMTIEERAFQLNYRAPAIPRLNIPEYNWWNEALHGVARAGAATMFPQAIAMAASFDEEMLQQVGDVISTEGRAKYNAYSSEGDRDIYKGLTFWSPNVNIFRDPRWGRGHETYGEDPYLTSRMGVSFIKGVQGEGKYLKAAACAKHLAAHSGPENIRHEFNSVVSKKDLVETYLPAFEACVKEGDVESIMGAYNRINGEPSCGSPTMLQKTLRDKWGFEGHVVSDCGAIMDFHMFHKITKTVTESAALALNNGCDLNCGDVFLHMLEALEEGKVVVFGGIVLLVLGVAVGGFVFWEPAPELIQGEAEATEVRISGKVPGRIASFLVNEGDRVEEGDTVAILDSPEVMAKYAQARAAEDAAEAVSEKARKGAREEQVAMAFQTWKKAEAASDVARKSYERVQRLYDNGVMSAQKRDEAEANYKAMAATELAAKSQYEMAVNGAEREDKLAAEAQVNRAKGAVAEVDAYIKETFLISPISGEVSERYPKVGELVGTGSPVMNVLDLDDMWVEFNVREDLLGDMKMGATFSAYIPALENREVTLKVTYMKDMGVYAAWRATKTTGQYDAKTFQVKAVPLEKVEGLRPGMSVLKKVEKAK